MEYRNHKDLSLSEIGVGCYTLSGVYGPKDVDHFRAMLRRAYELGVNFFDVAEGYGNAESILGEIIFPFRQKVHIATKVGVREGMVPNLSKKYIQKACELSLRNLQTDYIDLYQVHFDDPETPVAETVAALENLRREGKIRHYGICHLPFERVEQYMQLGNPFSLLMELSPVTRDSMDKLLPLCWKYTVGGIAFSTTGRGILAGCFNQETIFPDNDLRRLDPLFQRERFESGLRVANILAQVGRKYDKTPAQMAIAWVLAQPGIICALTGPSNIPHLEENLGASGWEIPVDDLDEIRLFLIQETENLLQKQTTSIKSILNSPLPADVSASFVDLLYVVETAIQLKVLSEGDGIPIIQQLFQFRDGQDKNSNQKMKTFQTRLLGIIDSYVVVVDEPSWKERLK